MMRTRIGMVLRSSEQTRLDSPVTAITDRAITSAPLSCTVTASDEQMPSTRTVIGLPFRIGFSIVSLSFCAMA